MVRRNASRAKLHGRDTLSDVFPICRAILGAKAWGSLLDALDRAATPQTLPDRLAAMGKGRLLPDFLPELARLEWTRHVVSKAAKPEPRDADRYEINPTLEVLPLSWRLCALTSPEAGAAPAAPRPGAEHAMIWRDPETGETRVRAADDAELLALKIVVEELDLAEAAAEARMSLPLVERALRRAAEKGLLLAPRTRIRRDPALYPIPAGAPESLVSCESFLIQWHITHACDLHCKHCYDRSKRSALTLEQGARVLDDLRRFCLDRRVQGHVCFTGGNPFLHPRFRDLYAAAAERGFLTSVLGNPTPRAGLEKLQSIQKLQYFQVSLEGLPQHNDSIRGAGHFARTIEFLGVLRDAGVYSTVMLTLTRDNMGQVLPLAERLRGHAENFTFNRLSQVGEGANLPLPSREEYAAFLEDYVDAARSNPIMGIKDNLINVVRRRRELPPFGGCTGHGCGAAFNFVAVLPDGEVHACRKFPSLIGNVLRSSLGEIYDSDAAQRYRAGCRACRACPLRPACGGCMAVAFGQGLNCFEQRDPHCFIEESPRHRAVRGRTRERA